MNDIKEKSIIVKIEETEANLAHLENLLNIHKSNLLLYHKILQEMELNKFTLRNQTILIGLDSYKEILLNIKNLKSDIINTKNTIMKLKSMILLSKQELEQYRKELKKSRFKVVYND